MRQIHESSPSSRHGLLQFKIIHRLRFSRVKLAKLFPSLDPVCEKCQAALASLIPMYWACPNLQSFQEAVFLSLGEVLGNVVDINPVTDLFGIKHEGTTSQWSWRTCTVVALTTLLARCLILLTCCWVRVGRGQRPLFLLFIYFCYF